MIEGEYGYRAQCAYPESLWLLPPARIGGQDKTTLDEKTVGLAHDLLIVRRSRYRTTVGYASHDHDLTELLGSDELGWFFSWRLTPWGGDCLARAFGESGLATTAFPTVSGRPAPLDRTPTRGDGRPTLERTTAGAPPLGSGVRPDSRRPDRDDLADRVHANQPGRRYVARTVAHHHRVLEQALRFAVERWYPQGRAV